jgi:hypothetical protein
VTSTGPVFERRANRHAIRVLPPYSTLLEVPRPVYFQCYVDDQLARDGQIYWTRKGLPVSCNKTNRILACNSTLLLKEAGVKDAGKYRCVLSNDTSTFYTAAIFVPAFLLNPNDETVILSKGKGILLDCGVSNSSNPQNTQVYWKHNGTDILVGSGPTLQLRGMEHSETGVYECLVYNGYGNPVSKKFHVVATRAPETIPTPVNNASVVEWTDWDASASSLHVLHPLCLYISCIFLWVIKY